MRVATDGVQIIADNTNVFSARYKVPSWAKHVRVQLVAPDSDWTFDCTINGDEMARDSAPHRTAADNTQSFDFRSAHIVHELSRGDREPEILVDVNVVTGGVGIVIAQYEG